MTRRVRSVDVESLLGLMGGAVMLSAIVVAATRLLQRGALPNPLVLAVFMAAIAVGEYVRISLPGSRDSAPMASAAALAFVMTTESPRGTAVVYHAPLPIAATAVAMVIGVLPHAVVGRRVRASDVANRLISVAVAALLFRELPLWQGRNLLQVQAGWTDRRWLSAAVMLAVSVIALTVEVVLSAAARASRDHGPFFRTVVDEFRAVLGLTAALSTTGTLIALAERPLGVVAVPLFLFPLVLTQFAVRRYSAVRATYRQTIRALSRLTELGGYTEQGHASRVASLAVAMGRDLGMSERDVVDLEYAALLHDIGQVALKEPIPGGATVMAAPADQRRIANDGADIVRLTGVLDNVAHIMEVQTTPYRQVREFGEDLPLSSRIIKVVNAFDDLVGDSRESSRQATAIERIHLGLGYEYDPRVVDSLARVLERRFVG